LEEWSGWFRWIRGWFSKQGFWFWQCWFVSYCSGGCW
jgi:hypothetical protein